MATKLFYGSTNGNTERVAEMIKEELGDTVEDMVNIADASTDDLAAADTLIMGTSTWQDGELQEDWEDFFPQLDDVDLSGKTVALFGLGDAYGYSGEFVNALGTLCQKVKERGATVVGEWPTEGYDFEHSDAVDGENFVGLVIDEDNDSDKTEERVKTWCEQIKGSL